MVIMLTPVAWAARGTTTMLIPDDGDLTITWTARTVADGALLRLYAVDASGSSTLLTEEDARRGVNTYHYVDRRNRAGLQVLYRLCVVMPDGRESSLALVNCLEPQMDQTDSTATSGSRAGFGLLESTDEDHGISSRDLLCAPDDLNRGTPPRPPVPPPRLVTAKDRHRV